MKKFLRDLLTDLMWGMFLMSIVIIMALYFVWGIDKTYEYKADGGTVIVTEHGRYLEPDPLPGGKMIAFY